MSRFVFSADGHIVEPKGLLMDGLPAAMRQFGIRSEKQDDYMVTLSGNTVRRRPRTSRNSAAPIAWGPPISRAG
jgi:hypothetical protein